MTTSAKTFHRWIGVCVQGGEVRAAVEDDYHHFRVWLQHDGTHVTQVVARAFRFPWTLCPNAAGEIQVLEGQELITNMADLGRMHAARSQCTHLFDLAALMMALAGRGVGRRRYEASIPYRIDDHTKATLRRDGRPILDWEVNGSVVSGEPPIVACDIGTGFTKLVGQLPPDDAEAALVLRRAVFVSSGRGTPADEVTVAPTFGGCFVQRPERAHLATRKLDLRRDFTENPTHLGTTDAEWLSFAV